MENYKELYENEKRQRLVTEATMKEIVNGLCLSAYTIAEDSKMQLLKNDLQRVQQELARLEATKQQRLQQHLMSVGGMIQQMSNANGGASSNNLLASHGSQGVLNNMNNNRQSSAAQSSSANFGNNMRTLSSFTNINNASNKNDAIDAQKLAAVAKGRKSTQNGQTDGNAAFQKPRAPRRKRGAAAMDENFRPSSAVPPISIGSALAVEKNVRPSSAVPPMSAGGDAPPPPKAVEQLKPSSLEETPTAVVQAPPVLNSIGSEDMSTVVGKFGGDKLVAGDANNANNSQVEEDIVMTETVVKADKSAANDKGAFFCEYCETAAVDVPSTVVHVWSHVNEIRRMHAFECVIKECIFKTNVMKEALAHKKTAHSPEEGCKILDRRDTLTEYFKHCVHKYFVHLDDPTKEQIFEARHN